MARWASALGLAACLALTRARAGADTFTHKKTRQELKGKLLGSVSRDGKTLFMVRLASGDARYLPEADWEVTREKPKRPERPPWPKVTYNGKVRDAVWLGGQYQKFKDKIALIGGKYYDIGSSHLWASSASALMAVKAKARYKSPGPFALGDCARARLTVLRVLGPSELIGGMQLVTFDKARGGKYRVGGSWSVNDDAQAIHVKGVSTEGVVTGASLVCEPLVVVGTYGSWSVDGGGRTMFSCRPLPPERAPLTRAQFAAALNGGFKLGEWRLFRKRKALHRPPGGTHKVVWHYGWQKVPVE